MDEETEAKLSDITNLIKEQKEIMEKQIEALDKLTVIVKEHAYRLLKLEKRCQ